jgi:transcription-repair coupling factor (superfamily II helicase)
MTTLFDGLFGVAKSLQITHLFQQHPKLVVVVPSLKEGERLYSDLQFLIKPELIYLYPAWDTLPFEHVSPELELTARRILSVYACQKRESWVLIVTVEALLQKTVPYTTLLSYSLSITRGQLINRDEMLQHLDLCGFQQTPRVESLGSFAVRGEVIDYFPSTHPHPVRLEFFDDEVEHIKLFETTSQRSIAEIEHTHVLPLSERVSLSSSPELLEEAIERVLHRTRELHVPTHQTHDLVRQINDGVNFPGQEYLQSLIVDPLLSFDSWIPHDATWIIDDHGACRESIDRSNELIDERTTRFTEERTFHVVASSLYLSNSAAIKLLEHGKILFNSFDNSNLKSKTSISVTPNTELTAITHSLKGAKGYQPVIDYIKSRLKKREKIAIVLGSQARASQMQDIRSSRNTPVKPVSVRKTAATLNQLNQGDFVVHLDYGIGRYHGLAHKVLDGVEGDFLEIEYADSTLLLPMQMIGKVQRYSTPTDEAPRLDRLSSNRWIKTKEKIRETVAALAGDLIKLYAKRSITRGWRFEPWGAEDERFAESFPYNETPDQQKAIDETLNDMASDSPMDRLICGDVGFGKTEVAIRAAFKCVQHARQVAMLTPTTLLCEQHANSFRERFRGYPVEVGVLSRFNTAKQNRETLNNLKNGTLDIVIGTHRLLSSDVSFKDLGLLIIDEEQRFGVKQKEQLKALKTQVDVLTLTATPIPRTLHMSLIGIRDVSIIATPPARRHAIKTYIARPDEASIRDAILREIQRGGQIFYLHNRVSTIEAVTAQLQEIVPEARIRFAHGQMNEHQLEDIMQRFIREEFQVLVSTTIVESGIDIPNANTIIISDSPRYGLAQLYQLRGRVGRGTRQAYAYLLTPPSARLSSDVKERLGIFASMEELGLGFELAMRDLEIRGSGNLLGKEQSGNVATVGFDLYTRILKEALDNLKGDALSATPEIHPEVNIGVVAYIPNYYIPDISERLLLYQRLADLGDDQETNDITDEISDRFGPPPPEVRDLIGVMRIRSMLRRLGVLKLERNKLLGFNLTLSAEAPFDLGKILQLTNKGVRFSKNLVLSTTNQWTPEQPIKLDQIFDRIEGLLEEIRS